MRRSHPPSDIVSGGGWERRKRRKRPITRTLSWIAFAWLFSLPFTLLLPTDKAWSLWAVWGAVTMQIIWFIAAIVASRVETPKWTSNWREKGPDPGNVYLGAFSTDSERHCSESGPEDK